MSKLSGKKSLAYSLKYQSDEKTLTDSDATTIRNKIIKRLDQVLGAKLRGWCSLVTRPIRSFRMWSYKEEYGKAPYSSL